MQTATSVLGKEIRLPDERWTHIVEGHPEMAGHRNDVLLTLIEPDFVASPMLVFFTAFTQSSSLTQKPPLTIAIRYFLHEGSEMIGLL